MNTASLPETVKLSKKDAFFMNLYRPPALKDKMTSVPQPPAVSDNLELSQIFQLPKLTSSMISSHDARITADNSAAFQSTSDHFQTSSSQFQGRGNGDIQSGSSWSSGCVPKAPDVLNDLMLTQAFRNRRCAEDKEDFDVSLSIFSDKTSQDCSVSTTNRTVCSSLHRLFDDSAYCGSKVVHPVSFTSRSNCRPPKSALQTSAQSEEDQFCLNLQPSAFDEAFNEDFDPSWDRSPQKLRRPNHQQDILSGPPEDTGLSSTTYSHENLQAKLAQPVYHETQVLKNHLPLHDKTNKLHSSFRTPFMKSTREVMELDDLGEKTKQSDLTHDFAGRFNSQNLLNFCTTPADQSVSDGNKLHPVTEIPEPYRDVFPFEYFNIVQSVVFADAFYTDKPLVVSAPTGSGKTVIFELAIIRLLIQQQRIQMNKTTTFKVVYMAPIKALCSERFEDWNMKFGPLGLKCMELTGDSEIEDYYELQEVNIILTTPEKWDHMTRRWRDNKSLVQLTRLFMIDEVHTLNDDVRGATLEAVVSRMKTVQSAIARTQAASSSAVSGDMAVETNLRFVAVSATIPNIDDIAEWLNSKNADAVYHKLDDSHRPVRLRKVVLGFPCADKTSEFRFDMTLNYKLAGIIQTYSELKPTLIFCSTRKGAVQAATTLVKEAKFMFNLQQKQKLQKFANSLRDTKLGDLITSGVGYHHAGMEMHDRKMVENIFAKGELAVLVSTSTLAMGVNLPAHLVIIKSTQHYVSGVYQEYSETQILQMIGRAGRPQFDTTATAVIMTRSSTKCKYESLLNGTQVIESSLHQHLVEHLNAETVLETISDVSVALEWIRSTFLYIRINKNPTHYGIPSGLTKDKVEQKLQELCLKNLNALASIQLVQMDEDCFALKSSNTGRLMARYCVAFETMKIFHNIVGKESLEEMLGILCQSHEFNDVQLRVVEKKTLNALNSSKNTATIRYPMQGKIKTAPMKVNCLIQTHLGSLPMQDFALQQDTSKIIRVCQRISRCLVEVLWNRLDFSSLLSAVIICKCFASKLWENSKFVSRQLTGIGITLATALVNAGMTSFEKISNTNARDLEMIVNRQPPFGNHIQEAVAHLPKYELSLKQTTQVMASYAEVLAVVTIMNANSLNEKCTTDKRHTLVLLIGDSDGKVVYKVRIGDAQLLQKGPWTRKVEVKRASAGDELSAHLISQQWVGLDCQMTFVPEYTTPAKTPIISQPGPTSTENRKTPKKLPVVKTKEAPVLPRNNSANGKRIQDAKMRTIESCLDNCKAAAMIKDKAAASSKITASSKTTASSKITASVDSCCRELKQRLEGYDKTPAAKRLKMGGVPSTPSLKDFAYQPSKPKILKHVASAEPAQLMTHGWEDLDLFQLRNKAAMEWTVQDTDLRPSFLQEDFMDADDDLDCYVAEDFQTDLCNHRNSTLLQARNKSSQLTLNSSFEELPDLNVDSAVDAWNFDQGRRIYRDQAFVDSKGRGYALASRIVERYNEDDFSDFEDTMIESCGLTSDECGKDLPSKISKLAPYGVVPPTDQTQKDAVRNSKCLSLMKPVPSFTGSLPGSYSGSSLISDISRANFDLMSSFSLNDDDDFPSPSPPGHQSLSSGVESNQCISKSKQLGCGSMMNSRSSSFFSSDTKDDGAMDEDHVISDDIFFGIF